MDDEPQELGGNISLVGFRDLDHGSMIIIKKIVGNYVKKFSRRDASFQNLTITMKPIRKTEKSTHAYGLKGRITLSDRTENAELVGHNLFFAIDKTLKSLERQL
jgi:hypothetical protein